MEVIKAYIDAFAYEVIQAMGVKTDNEIMDMIIDMRIQQTMKEIDGDHRTKRVRRHR